MRKLRVGIDIDGTITACSEMFSALTKGLKAAGHEIFIVTFRDECFREVTIRELGEYGIEYDHLIMRDNVRDPPWKGIVAKENKLDVFFEDDPMVLNAMSEGIQKVAMVPRGMLVGYGLDKDAQ